MDTILLAKLATEFSENPSQFWQTNISLPTNSLLSERIPEIEDYALALGLKRDLKQNEIHFWKVSRLYDEGIVQTVQFDPDNPKALTAKKYVFKQMKWGKLKKRKFRLKFNKSYTTDSLLTPILEQHWMQLPFQPQAAFLCTKEQVYVYLIEIMYEGRYRVLVYADPEYYAKLGSWTDQRFLSFFKCLDGK
ncbi:MAG: hypothetical protein MK212_04605 [Saprospiraceae bacterium]|nr:hypothetical protein [Saprospiraceae bacterium]